MTEAVMNQEAVTDQQPAEATDASAIATEGEAGDDGEIQAPSGEARWTQDEAAQFAKRMGIPEEYKAFVAKDGQLRFAVPINGRYYVATPQDVFRGFNLQQAGYQMMDEAKRTAEESRAKFDEVKKDPRKLWQIADELGIDKHDLAYELLSQHVDELKLDPEARAKAAKEREEKTQIEREREELETLRLEKLEQQQQAAVSAERERLNTQFVSALTKHGFKPTDDAKTKSAVLAAAIGKMMLAQSRGHELSPEDAVFFAKQDFQTHIMSVLDDVPDDNLVSMLPRRVVEAIRRADISKLESRSIPPTSGSVGRRVELRDAGPARSKSKKLNMSDYFENLS